MRYLLLFILPFLFIACDNDTNSYTIEGTTQGLPDGARVYFYKLDTNGQPKVIDTVIVQNNRFVSVFPKVDNASINYIKADYIKTNLYYFPENSNLKATLFKDKASESSITGSPQNDNYTAYQQELNRLQQEQVNLNKKYTESRRAGNTDEIRNTTVKINNTKNDITNHKLKFVDTNPNSIYAAMVVSELINKREITPAIASQKINALSPKVLASGVAKKVISTVNTMKASEVGGVAPNFKAPTPEGELLSLKDVMGEYTIIDFWASWCRPCRMENPNVVRVYEEYHDKGLNIISVSLDRANQKDRWIKAIKDDKMNWHHVSNLKFWNDPIAKQYGVRSIPATFLLDKEGNIIDKNLRGKRLETKIASLLK